MAPWVTRWPSQLVVRVRFLLEEEIFTTAELQIRGGIEDNLNDVTVFLISQRKHML